ncbi:MAG: MFS transporter [Bosea sp. (in: a-proteobacteria)]|uniref:MFS transporter n=1 Tax=unclassified Bosea (in: a-proteobacteria) TaxID=2653178 RepID=UPI0009647093|nr:MULTISPECIES: MFS transporter [unclassified Bosea (in: a-proteobacteria)]MBN9444760.1 MFS transporter [Bosea sp. (in: a-proteobacteria)]MBN9456028.1 MFS transporter [Bosea sp. (in: a-proteobacteria)]OJV05553.1 MAG: MFS transporter [Bosea sp. 67-29]
MTAAAQVSTAQRAMMPVLIALSFTHLLNDMIQSLIPAIYPIIKESYRLDFGQIGLITLTFQVSASLLQPAVGLYTDKHPMPYSMVVGMGFTLSGLIGLAYAGSYGLLLLSAACVGIGSSIFHPEATRMARNASGGQHGLAQGIFQLGGQTGGALGPLLAAFVIVPRGQGSLAWFSVAALVAMMLMVWTAASYARLDRARPPKPAGVAKAAARPGKGSVAFAITILIVLLFSKNAYTASFSSFYTFYLMGKFGVSIQHSQEMLFLFLASSAAGAVGGGMLGDRIGRNKIIWFSILGALPFTLILPYADLFWTGVLTVIINIIMSSAFAAILIYALELLPGRVGLVGGFFYGLSFGLGGLAAALLGEFADLLGIEMVYKICSFIPLVGLLAWFLPRLSEEAHGAKVGH